MGIWTISNKTELPRARCAWWIMLFSYFHCIKLLDNSWTKAIMCANLYYTNKKLNKEWNSAFKIPTTLYTCLRCCVKSTCNAWLMGSHESIYEYWELIWRRVKGTAWLSQLSFLKRKKMPGFLELPGKNKQDFIRESTSHWVLMWNWRLLSEGSYVNRYSAVTIQPQNMWFL